MTNKDWIPETIATAMVPIQIILDKITEARDALETFNWESLDFEMKYDYRMELKHMEQRLSRMYSRLETMQY